LDPVLEGPRTLWIPGPLPGLNEIIALRASRYKGAYSEEKRRWNDAIKLCAMAASLGAFVRPVRVHFDLREQSRRRDPDNVFAGASKFCLDALVKCGVLPNDGWANIAALSCSWSVDAQKPGVLVTIDYA
jgi:hypothetical protein